MRVIIVQNSFASLVDSGRLRDGRYIMVNGSEHQLSKLFVLAVEWNTRNGKKEETASFQLRLQ